MGANITAARCANLGPPTSQRHGLAEPFHLSPRNVRAVRDQRVEPGDDDQWSRAWAFALAGAHVSAHGARPGQTARHDVRPSTSARTGPRPAIPVGQFSRRVVSDATQNRDFRNESFGPLPRQNRVAGHALFTIPRQNATHEKERDTAMYFTRDGVPRNRPVDRFPLPARAVAGTIATNPHGMADHVG